MVNNCVLELQQLVFDEFDFKRQGFKNDNEYKIVFEVSISRSEEDDIYKVSLGTKIKKEDEYNLNIKLSGFFTFNGDKDKKNIFLKLCRATDASCGAGRPALFALFAAPNQWQP